MNLLTIETTCDETAAAIVTDRLEVLASVVASQDALHERFGGVVPEIASRAHVERILPVIDETLRKAGLKLGDLDAIAVANTPGLAGSLLVGLTAAKALCVAWDLPLLAVNHLQAHIYACRLASGRDVFPCIGLIVSGGHSNIYRCDGPTDFTPLGGTIDDAAGEAFDKVASLLGLPYPGGPSIERAARGGDPRQASVSAAACGRPRALGLQLQRPENGGAIPGSRAGKARGAESREQRTSEQATPRASLLAPALSPTSRRVFKKRLSIVWSTKRNWRWRRPGTARCAWAVAWRPIAGSANGSKPRRPSAATNCTCRRWRCAPITRSWARLPWSASGLDCSRT